MPDVRLYVNGRIYSGWKSISIARSLDAISGRFDLETMDRWDAQRQPWTIFPGDECELKIDGTPVITGYVDRASPSFTAESHGIGISGRDRTSDLVDCSAVIKGNELRGLKLEQIAAAIAKPFGIKVAAQVSTGPAFSVFAIQPGETCWEAIERAARQRFMVVSVDGSGNLIIADVGTTRAADKLVEGVNLKEAGADYDYSQRFSSYKVRGQQSAQNDGAEVGSNDIESSAADPAVKRYRPKILTAETQATDGSATNRAELEAATRAGKSTRITATVQGWTMSNGALWPVNALVTVQSRLLSVNEDLVISSVRFGLSDSAGFTTELELTRPDAYLMGQRAKKGRRKKKASDFEIGPEPWELPGYD